MVVIDVHTHISKKEFIPNEITKMIVEEAARRIGIAPEKVMRNLEKHSTIYQASPENLIKEMDEAGIDKSILLTIDYGLVPGLSKPKISIEEYNKWVADAADQYPDRLIAFAGVDPRRKNAVEILEKAVQEWGMKGLKLYPPCGFYPNEPVVMPLWEKSNELEIPVMVHSGPTFPQLKMKYSQPIYLEDVLVRYPNLNVIIAHLGGGIWTEEVIALRRLRNNVYTDISGWQDLIYADKENAIQRLVHTYSILRSKCLFGSDWPAFNHQLSHKEWVNTINGLNMETKLKKKLLGENAQKILKL
ncbi:MAG: amidohydrolase family protein [Candidatus Bathyarchaeaceae archaeon]